MVEQELAHIKETIILTAFLSDGKKIGDLEQIRAHDLILPFVMIILIH